MLMKKTEDQSLPSSFRLWISAQDIQAAKLYHDKFMVFEFFFLFIIWIFKYNFNIKKTCFRILFKNICTNVSVFKDKQ